MAVQEVDIDEPGPRPAQRRRTRKAIVAAAAELLKAGETPSVGQVAEAADVSRRTVYQYFPTVEQLRARLAPDRFELLVSALSMVIGWESLVVLSDVRGLAPDDQLEVQLWAARSLLRAAVDSSS